MMVTHLITKRILIFLGFAFGIPWTAALVLYLTLGIDNPIRAATLANTIFITTPALANIATRLITKEGWGRLWLRPNFRRGWRFYLAVWLLPLLAVSVGGTIFYLLFPQSFDPNLSGLRELVASSPSLAAANPWMTLLFITLQLMIVGLTINGLASIGEEFGWRAYLLPKLMERFTGVEPTRASEDDPAYAGGQYAAAARKASLLIGVIWGVWHFPLIIMGMSMDPTMTLSRALVFLGLYVLFTCSLSVLLCWGTLRSGSVWPAAIGHGTINSTSTLAGFLLKGTANPLLGPGPTGLIGVVGYLALALVLLFNRRAFTAEKEASSERVRAEVITSHS
jgi:membrane protease YdiL (CAAX protease family)